MVLRLVARFGCGHRAQNEAAAGIFRGGNFLSGLTTFQVFQDLDSNVVTRFRWFCTWFFRTPVNKFSMDDRIQTGFLGSNGLSVFQGFGRSGFSQFSDAWILLSDVWTFGFSGYWFFRTWIVSFADTKMEKRNRVGKLIR